LQKKGLNNTSCILYLHNFRFHSWKSITILIFTDFKDKNHTQQRICIILLFCFPFAKVFAKYISSYYFLVHIPLAYRLRMASTSGAAAMVVPPAMQSSPGFYYWRRRKKPPLSWCSCLHAPFFPLQVKRMLVSFLPPKHYYIYTDSMLYVNRFCSDP
jgi:hypothetical protein